jgi:outer membrane protein TolC
MATLDTQVRLLNRAGELRAALDALDDRRAAARARFKSALGLAPVDPDPPWPHFPLRRTELPPEGQLWRAAVKANPDLAAMRATVDLEVAGIESARMAKTPDFGVGAMYDSMPKPLPVRPNAYVTLPIWRDKIAAAVAGAEARRDAALARLNAGQIGLAAEIAQSLYVVRESDRTIRYIDETALPNLGRAVAFSEAAYESGAGGAGMISETQLMALDMRLERIDALRDRETAVTDLLLALAAVAPADAPLLAEAPAAP